MNRRKKTSLRKSIILSVLIHLIIILFLILGNLDSLKVKDKNKTAKKEDFIEITEYKPPKKKETEPPKNAKLLAEKSHKAEKEKTKDTTTRLAKKSPPKPKVAKKPNLKKQNKKVVKKKTTEKTKKQKDIKKKDKVLRDHKLAALPKKKWLRREQDKSNKPENLSPSSQNFSVPNPSNLPPLEGARNIPRKEETVDLNTKEFKYFSYFLKLKRQIEGVWHYPTESAQRGEQGHLNVIFTITKTGYLEDVKIIKSSGYGRLDSEAIRAIRVASPYTPFPQSWDGLERLNVRATFEYNFAWKLR